MPAFSELPFWLRQILAGVALFLIGGALSFAYSYRPLHGAKNWQLEQLETRLHAVNRENLALSDKLEALRASEAERVDPETLAQVEKELEKTRSALDRAEKQLKRAEEKHRDATSTATRWRKRYEELRDAQEAMAARPPVFPPPAAPTSDPSPTSRESSASDPRALPAAPSAPAPPSSPAQQASPDPAERGMLGGRGSAASPLP